MRETIQEIEKLKNKILETRKFLDLDKTRTEIKALEYEMGQPEFWNDQKKATAVSKKAADLSEEVEAWDVILKETADLLEIAELDEEDQDVNLRKDIEEKLGGLQKRFGRLEFSVMLGKRYDKSNAIVSFFAGAGGTDAQDWTEMLLRMYLRFCEKKGWQAEIVDQSKGGEAGIKSAAVLVKGRYAYGWLRSESGVHRLVRISPFDAEKMRHTAFTLVDVMPETEEVGDIEISPDDLRIDTFLSSGHGGQSVQTTYSAVRLVHLPTNITVTCQNERSQIQNKETAMKILKSKLRQYYEAEREEERQKIRGEFKPAAWGNQIRSYILHPYQMVKDHRSGCETSDTESVLDGNLDGFIEASLKKEIKNSQ